MGTDQKILTVNAGSSSLKFALYAAGEDLQKIVEGAVLNIGQQKGTLRVTDWQTKNVVSNEVVVDDHDHAAGHLLNWLDNNIGPNVITAVGHRLVHGGPIYSDARVINDQVLENLQQIVAFDPLHMPTALQLVRVFQRLLPKKPQVACFDTAFHYDLPVESRVLPIPRQYEARGIRRYGFHGLSYTYILQTLASETADGTVPHRIIFAHLGSGASMAAVKEGKSIDTTMAFTPGSGLPMSSRSGDLDPGLMSYFVRTTNINMDEFDKLTNTQSGLLGISGLTSDMKQLIELSEKNHNAADAVAIFCYNIKKTIGAYTAAMGGVDSIVFTGGIGESAPIIRAKACENLETLGVIIDQSANEQNAAIISRNDSKVLVRIIPTDESLIIAQETNELAKDLDTN